MIIKQTKNNGELVIKEIDYLTAKEMIINNHYSKKWNTSFGVINIGIFKDDVLLGCASFGNLMNPNSYSKICDNKNQIIELNRLWIHDDLKKNAESILISSSINIIKKCYPDIKFIQSFADGRLGCGTIYKASNFDYYGYSESLFFENIETGETFHKVPLENTKRPLGFLNKNRLYLDHKLKAFKTKTYRYIYNIYKKQQTKLEKLTYPLYEKGLIYIDYKHSLSLLCRLRLMYLQINDNIYADKCLNELLSSYNQSEIDNETLHQLNNESYQYFINQYLKNDFTKLLQNIN